MNAFRKAIEFGNNDLVRELLKAQLCDPNEQITELRGTDPHSNAVVGNNAFHDAAIQCNWRMFSILMDHYEKPVLKKILRTQNSNGQDPLWLILREYLLLENDFLKGSLKFCRRNFF